MKRIITVLICAVFTAYNANSQSGVAINTSGSPADPSAMLDVSSSTGGFLLSRMTTQDRNSISSPALGLMIFNTTTNCLEIFISPVWQPVYCGCNPPVSPVAAANIPSQTSVMWKWYAVQGATGYKYNTINDFASATDNGPDTSYTQSGLTCATSYTLYVWAYSNCSNSSATNLNSTTTSCMSNACGVITFNYNGASVSYGTVAGQNSTCWLDRNLGASQVATAYNDVDSYGDLFQWGRLDDGHQVRTSTTTTTLSAGDVPGHSNFIITTNSPKDWRSGQNDNLWQSVSGANNPCPSGWRIPTQNEFNNEYVTWSPQDNTGAFASPLKLPSAGGRYVDDAQFYHVGISGFCWTAAITGTNAYHFYFTSGGGGFWWNFRGDGGSVRCIKD